MDHKRGELSGASRDAGTFLMNAAGTCERRSVFVASNAGGGRGHQAIEEIRVREFTPPVFRERNERFQTEGAPLGKENQLK